MQRTLRKLILQKPMRPTHELRGIRIEMCRAPLRTGIFVTQLPTLAIVIPVGPGDHAWRELLPELQDIQAEQIVLAFAQGDASNQQYPVHGATVIVAPVGRAQQLNAGAAATHASWIWFVHADSRMTPNTLSRLRQFTARTQTAIGYFDLRFHDDGPRLVHLNEWGAWLRSRVLGLPFGDQGLLMPRSVFDALGGFDRLLDGGEDHALVWKARRAGIPLRAIGAPLLTSARKYARQGWLRTTARHLTLTWRQARVFSKQDCTQ